MREIAPPFYTAVWELCRRGILRPGHRTFLMSSDGNAPENLYTITDFGRKWLSRTELDELSAIVPARFVELLHRFVPRYGGGFRSRAEQAVIAYHAQAYLAACAMCGAASESIMLAIASERFGADRVLTEYGRAGGRAKVRKMLVGSASATEQQRFDGYIGSIDYWRDESAHGRASDLGETEAFVALHSLLRFARYAAEAFPSEAKRKS